MLSMFFIYRIQSNLSCSKSTRKVSRLSRNAHQGRAPTEDFVIAMMFLRAAVLIIGLSTLSSVFTSVVSAEEEINATLPNICCNENKKVFPLFLRSREQSRDDSYTDMREVLRCPTPFQLENTQTQPVTIATIV